MKIISIFEFAGEFAENKDEARRIRQELITPVLKELTGEVILDFSGVQATTQSFIHALISSLIREYGGDVLERISFRNCNETVKKIVGIVVDYMQES